MVESIDNINQDDEYYDVSTMPTHFLGVYINRPTNDIAQDILVSSPDEDVEEEE